MYVYRFIDSNNIIIYIGKTKVSLRTRFYSHNHLPDECYKRVHYIEYIECSTESDMSMKEIYYINQEHAKGNAIYNTADVSAASKDFNFNDNWKKYIGSLPESFSNSINYIEKYIDDRDKVITASDGRQMILVNNSKYGVEKYVYPFSAIELSKIFEFYRKQMHESTYNYREYSYFKYILLVAIGISTPFKSKEIIALKYSDVFNEDDEVMGYRLVRNNITYEIPYPQPVIKLLNVFQNAYGDNFKEDRNKYIFVGNTGEKVSYSSVNKSILSACSDCDIKNFRHSNESLRKTYFRNIFDESENICEAIECIEFLSGTFTHSPGRVLKYINAIPHNSTLNVRAFIKNKYIIDKIDFDWNINFKYEDKWVW